MDTIALVNEQIEDGKFLLGQITRAGFEVAAAFWAKFDEQDRWRFCVVSPMRASEQWSQAFDLLHPILYGMPQPFSIHPLEIKFLSPSQPAAKAVLDILQRPGWKTRLHYSDRQLASAGIEAAYIYYPGDWPAEKKE